MAGKYKAKAMQDTMFRRSYRCQKEPIVALFFRYQ